jgi:hypothetical protein
MNLLNLLFQANFISLFMVAIQILNKNGKITKIAVIKKGVDALP